MQKSLKNLNLKTNSEVTKDVGSISHLTSIRVCSSQQVAEYLRTIWDKESFLHCESVYVVLLNRDEEIIDSKLLNIGTWRSTYIDMRRLLMFAFVNNAFTIVIAHNHPSGDPKPSQADLDRTESIQTTLKECDLILKDHVIISDKTYYSFRDNKLLD